MGALIYRSAEKKNQAGLGASSCKSQRGEAEAGSCGILPGLLVPGTTPCLKNKQTEEERNQELREELQGWGAALRAWVPSSTRLIRL